MADIIENIQVNTTPKYILYLFSNTWRLTDIRHLNNKLRNNSLWNDVIFYFIFIFLIEFKKKHTLCYIKYQHLFLGWRGGGRHQCFYSPIVSDEELS